MQLSGGYSFVICFLIYFIFFIVLITGTLSLFPKLCRQFMNFTSNNFYLRHNYNQYLLFDYACLTISISDIIIDV
jgi:hypothetical protein